MVVVVAVGGGASSSVVVATVVVFAGGVVVVVVVVVADDEPRDAETMTAIAVAEAETARKNSAGRIQALELVMTPAGTASVGDSSDRGGRQPLSAALCANPQRWMTTSRSSVISRTAYAGPSFVLPEAFTPPYGIWSERNVGASLTVTPPKSSASAQRSAVSIDAVKTPACSPNGVPFARSIASSIESTGLTMTTGPKTSSQLDLRRVGNAGEHRRPDQAARFAAREHRRARGLRLLDPREDPRARVLVDHRADVGVVVGRVADLQRLDRRRRTVSRTRRRPARST